MMIFQQLLTTLFSAIVSVGVAVAGAYKFFASFSDRRHQKRVNAASVLAGLVAKDKLTQELRSFGNAHIRRMYFSDVTGLDVERGHYALLQLHIELGGRDRIWLELRGMKEHLLLSRKFARVRRLKRADIAKIILATLGGLISLGGTVLFLLLMLKTSIEILNERISFVPAFSQLAVSLGSTTLLGFISILAIRWARRRVNAAWLRTSIYKVRRRTQVVSTGGL